MEIPREKYSGRRRNVGSVLNEIKYHFVSVNSEDNNYHTGHSAKLGGFGEFGGRGNLSHVGCHGYQIARYINRVTFLFYLEHIGIIVCHIWYSYLIGLLRYSLVKFLPLLK